MSNWQKISLRDAVGKVVFDDEWGFIRFDGNVSYSVGGHDLSYYYLEEDGQKSQIRPNTYSVKDLISLFSKQIYYRNQNYGYYGRNQQQYLSVAVEEITVTLNNSDRYSYNTNRFLGQHSFVIKKKDKKRLEYLRHVWICDEIQDDKSDSGKRLRPPLFKDLKVGDEILLNGQKHLIGVVYEQPNESGYMFAATPSYEGAKGASVNVTFNDTVCVLPYEEQSVPETEQFNTYKNEFELSPYIVKSGQCLNVYWNKIEDAAEYIVALYKKYDRPYLQKIYHLKDYTVERNDGFVSIDGLMDEGYIVTVRAENRNGEEIALSRGIPINSNKQCIPQYWKE